MSLVGDSISFKILWPSMRKENPGICPGSWWYNFRSSAMAPIANMSKVKHTDEELPTKLVAEAFCTCSKHVSSSKIGIHRKKPVTNARCSLQHVSAEKSELATLILCSFRQSRKCFPWLSSPPKNCCTESYENGPRDGGASNVRRFGIREPREREIGWLWRDAVLALWRYWNCIG